MSKSLSYTKARIEKTDNGEFTAIASTDRLDRHGEVVEVSGWDLKEFKKDPVILWGHDHSEPAIGKATRVWIDKTGSKPVLKFKAFITEATQRAREIKQLMDEGILNSFSVGFKPIDAEDNVYTKHELLEISVVNVPANPDAQILAYKSLKQAGFSAEEMEEVGIQTGFVETLGAIDERVKLLENKLTTAVKGLNHLNPHIGRDQRITKDRLMLSKVAVKAADKLLTDKSSSVRMAKIVKRANEQLIVSLKGELNGTGIHSKRP